jgi:hypothetical protein
MSSTYSTSLRIQLIDTGTEDEAWGIPTDNNLGTIIEQAITGVESVSLTNLTNYTLTAANAVADQSRNAVLVFTGALSANCNVIAPAVNKVYVISNQTTGGKNISITMGSGANVAVANGTNQLVYCNGSSFKSAIDVNSIIGNLAVSGNSTVSGNVTVGTNVVMGNTLTTTNGNLSLRSTTSNVVNFQGTTGALTPPTGTTAQRPSSPVVGMSRWNTTLGLYEIWNGSIWQAITGSFTAAYLIVGGGGGGGTNGYASNGGGGAGGFLSNSTTITAGTAYAIVVGAGGSSATNGANSSAFGITALGGGGGGTGPNANGQAGASGAGGNSVDYEAGNGGTGGAGTSGQGSGGGSAINGFAPGWASGGGGGAGGSGGTASRPDGLGTAQGGNGGIGLQSSITGVATYYAGGGGGFGDGRYPSGSGSGGAGGGGSGSGVAGTANTGGGGGGGRTGITNGAVGGSGVVIISYASIVQRSTGGTVTSYSSGGTTYWVHTFTSSGTFTG